MTSLILFGTACCKISYKTMKGSGSHLMHEGMRFIFISLSAGPKQDESSCILPPSGQHKYSLTIQYLHAFMQKDLNARIGSVMTIYHSSGSACLFQKQKKIFNYKVQ